MMDKRVKIIFPVYKGWRHVSLMTDTSTAVGKIIAKLIFVHRRALTTHNCWKTMFTASWEIPPAPYHVHFLEIKFLSH
jgi:hypothetical protein